MGKCVILLSAQCIKSDTKASPHSASQIWPGDFQDSRNTNLGYGFLRKPGDSSSLWSQMVLVRLSWSSDLASDVVICPKLRESWFTPWQGFKSGSIQLFETDNLSLLLISLSLILFYILTNKYIMRKNDFDWDT